MNADDFATILQALRTRAGFSQSDLAERCGLSVRTIQNWEIGRNEPKWSQVCILARGLKVKLTAFALHE